MNEHLLERFGRSTRGPRKQQERAEVWLLPPRLNASIRAYYEAERPTGSAWLSQPEVPSAAELLDIADGDNGEASPDVIELMPNKRVGAFASKEQYLQTQYELLREDASRPLREGVSLFKSKPWASEDEFMGKIGIYTKVHMCALVASTKGIAIRVTFSLGRVGKRIKWEQSKRLISGSLVVLTPADDMFQSEAIVATVASRQLALIKDNELNLFFARTEDLEIDPNIEYVMIEDRSSYFEAQKHTLVALQRMMDEPFPLAEHLVKAQKSIPPPQYVLENPVIDMSSVFESTPYENHENINIMDWQARPRSSKLDRSQCIALKGMLSRRLAMVQGPPGTGKTFVSAEAIKIMLANRKQDDPPMIIACQTNHAVDQLLRQVAQFEPDFIRLGGRSKDKDVIKKRTLYEVRNQTSENPPAGNLSSSARKKMRDLGKEIGILLAPLAHSKTPLDHHVLEALGLITKAQAESLEKGSSRWVQDTKANPNHAKFPFTTWLGSHLRAVPPKQKSDESGFEFEEGDLEVEQLRDLEAENSPKDDEEFDVLHGEEFALADNFTAKALPGTTAGVQAHLQEQDLWKIPQAFRPAVYVALQKALKSHIRDVLREKAKLFDAQATSRKIGRFEMDEPLLRRQKIIGMTTTGLSKYRGLISAMGVKVVLVEEAGETLEAPTAVACIPSLQHLILVGDQQQLRPHTNVRDYSDKPFYLNISLFERLINNRLDYDALTKQRRMIPEVRRLLQPIYGNLITDHESVNDPENRPDVPGMGGVNSWFMTHDWLEARDDLMSAYNLLEAVMIAGFVEYLVYNGMPTAGITILTFYNGQRKRILSELRAKPVLQAEGHRLKVVTVDSYQGEENDVVILSLVRSNKNGSIGFLSNDNRVCVSLSRARRGFYLFGNGELLHNHSETWAAVLTILAGQKNDNEVPLIHSSRLAIDFKIRCQKHNKERAINHPRDWDGTFGGCTEKCGSPLPCDHMCELTCHPFPHEVANCQKCPPAKKTQATPPSDPFGKLNISDRSSPDRRTPSGSDSASWQSFASAEPDRYAKAAADVSAQSQRPSPQDNNPKKGSPLKESTLLIDLDSDDDLVLQTEQLSVAEQSTAQTANKGK